MQQSYDPRTNIAYIKLKPKSSEVESVKISDELIVDIATDGSIYGIELLNANEQLNQEEEGTLSIINEATGEEVSISLPS